MNLIQKELELAKSQNLDVIEADGRQLVCLTPENVAKVEAMIANDSAYLRSSNKEAKPDGNYEGSSAYWLTMLKKEIRSGVNSKKLKEYRTIIEGTVKAIDRENSTHINADTIGRDVIADRLCELEANKLLELLQATSDRKYKLFNYIAEKTSDEVKNARRNPSFASKFCHYACFYLFEGEDDQDNYSIFDSVMKKVLPWYMELYHIDTKKFDLNSYESYCMAVDAIRDKADKKISRNGFDHLLWYYHKGRL